MNRIDTAGLELFNRLHIATLKHANAIGTAKYAKHEKKNTDAKKYKMQFNRRKLQKTRKGRKGNYG